MRHSPGLGKLERLTGVTILHSDLEGHRWNCREILYTLYRSRLGHRWRYERVITTAVKSSNGLEHGLPVSQCNCTGGRLVLGGMRKIKETISLVVRLFGIHLLTEIVCRTIAPFYWSNIGLHFQFLDIQRWVEFVNLAQEFDYFAFVEWTMRFTGRLLVNGGICPIWFCSLLSSSIFGDAELWPSLSFPDAFLEVEGPASTIWKAVTISTQCFMNVLKSCLRSLRDISKLDSRRSLRRNGRKAKTRWYTAIFGFVFKTHDSSFWHSSEW